MECWDRVGRGHSASRLGSSALAVISVAGGTLTDYARGGSAVEAVWITAQQRGLAVQPVSPVFLYASDAEDLTEVSTSFSDELGQLQQEFRQSSPCRPVKSPSWCCDSLSTARRRCGAVAV